MASYNVLIKPSATKELQEVPPKDRRKVVAKIRALAHQPRLIGCEKLSGKEQYRLRQGRYRIVYSISDKDQTVLIFKIAHRKDACR